MNKILKVITTLDTKKYLFLLITIGYLPIFVFGYFIQDDYGVLGLHDLNIFDAAKSICTVNNNRPLSCLYHALLTRIFPIYQFYLLSSLLFYLGAIFFITKSFNFIIDSIYLKKIFISFILFPFFSYTILYSPVMQSMGSLSFLIWSISLLFLKKYIQSNKPIYIFLSYLFSFLMFLVYESSAPLLGISIFFPLFFKKKRLFYINLFFIFAIFFVIFFLQKIIFPKIFNADLSRIKINPTDFKKILYLFSINIILSINILFYSIEMCIRVILEVLSNLNLFKILQSLILIFIFYKTLNRKLYFKKNKNHKIFIVITFLIFITVFSLNALMHTVADTGLEFTQYNNRALVSLSVVFSLCIVICFRLFNYKKNFIYSFFLFSFFSVAVINFIYFQNNLISQRFLSKNIYNHISDYKNNNQDLRSLSSSDANFFLFTNQPIIDNTLSYNTYDYFNYIRKKNEYFIFLNENKFCNPQYYNLYIKDPYINENNKINLFIYNIKNLGGPIVLKFNISPNEFYKTVDSVIKCQFRELSESASNLIGKKVYLDSKYDGLFLSSVKKFYYFLFI